ncbi:unnamed protein product [Lampetra planeri]
MGSWRQSPSGNNGGRRSDAHNNERSAGRIKRSRLAGYEVQLLCIYRSSQSADPWHLLGLSRDLLSGSEPSTLHVASKCT